jgi:multifunctional beta-oxidation protein
MALVTATSKTTFKNNDKEELAATRQTIIAIKGLGGFGYKGNGTTLKIPERPTRNSDFTIEAQSYPGQAFLYRLSGDRNPLHIKPDIAAVQSFPQPIIHGIPALTQVSLVMELLPALLFRPCLRTTRMF